MSPVTHLLARWLVTNNSRQFGRKERIMVTAAGLIPDVDGFGIVAGGPHAERQQPPALAGAITTMLSGHNSTVLACS